jgi:uncharacterized protein YpiB (UPF0302 family)
MKIQQTTFNKQRAFEIVNNRKQQLFQIVFSTKEQAENYINNLTDQQKMNIFDW